MTTLAKIEANHQNAQLSTGPKSDKGKAASKMNAVAHGLRSLAPVIPGERAKDWNEHRKGIVTGLAPVGALEAELADRVALLAWRLRRVARYEAEATRAGIEDAVALVRGEKDEDDPLKAIPSPGGVKRTYATVRRELEAARADAGASAEFRDQLRRLPGLPANAHLDGSDAFSLLLNVSGYTPDADKEVTDIEDHEFLAEVGVPEEWRDDPDWWDGWTAGMVRAGVKIIAEDGGMTEAELIEKGIREADRDASREQRQARKLESQLAYYAEQIADNERVARGEAILPSAEVLDKVMRYEGHLNKQLMQALHELERLQAIRAGNPPAPPAALDVTVEAGGLTLNPAG